MNTKLAIGCLLSLVLVGTASAGQRHRHRDRVWVPARYEIVQRQVVVPAEYRIVQRQVWVEPVYEWRYRQVQTPHRKPGLRFSFGKRGKLHLDLNLGRRRGRHHEHAVRERVCVRQGYYTNVTERVLVHDEYIDVVSEQVLVREGHWKKLRRGHHRRDVDYQVSFRY